MSFLTVFLERAIASDTQSESGSVLESSSSSESGSGYWSYYLLTGIISGRHSFSSASVSSWF